MKWIVESLASLGTLDGDSSLRHQRWQDIPAIGRVCSPIPERQTKHVRSVNHGGLLISRILIGDVLCRLDELLLEETDIRAVPSEEEDGIVRTVAIGAGAGAALPNAIPAHPWYTVNTGELIERILRSLGAGLELPHRQQEQRPLVRLLLL